MGFLDILERSGVCSTLAGPPWRPVPCGEGWSQAGRLTPTCGRWRGCVGPRVVWSMETSGLCRRGPTTTGGGHWLGQDSPSQNWLLAVLTSRLACSLCRTEPGPPFPGWETAGDTRAQSVVNSSWRHFYHDIGVEHIGRIKLKFYYLPLPCDLQARDRG